jgi:hypothetical protein
VLCDKLGKEKRPVDAKPTEFVWSSTQSPQNNGSNSGGKTTRKQSVKDDFDVSNYLNEVPKVFS